ncbi:MAG: hypothetical protein ACREUQ_11580, partial [Burkholderiales bacterium]
MIPVRTRQFMQAAGGQACALTSYLHYRRAPAPHDRPSPFDASGNFPHVALTLERGFPRPQYPSRRNLRFQRTSIEASGTISVIDTASNMIIATRLSQA